MSLDSIQNNPEMKAYFDTLPPMVQETIVQSGVQADSLETLKKIALTLGVSS